ncbi:MAG TPA: VWA domain-containing protein [Xenococcaceae cyanobacterium]
MKVKIKPALSDRRISSQARTTQRQLSLAISAVRTKQERDLTLNLGLVIDVSGSMAGKPLDAVKQAAIAIIKELHPGDHLSLITFNHQANTVVQNQLVQNVSQIETQINQLVADGGTALDEGLKLGIKEVATGRRNTVSQIFLLTDGDNEDGDNRRCLKLAQLASDYNITIHALGLGKSWNQDILETIGDRTRGSLTYIEQPEMAIAAFKQLFQRLQSVGLINGYLTLELMPGVRLAELKPLAQVYPTTIELPVTIAGNRIELSIGDLMTNPEKVILVNLYLNQLTPGKHSIATVQVTYDDPALGRNNLQSLPIPVYVEAQTNYQSQVNQQVQKSILTLAKYRQAKIAEAKLLPEALSQAETMGDLVSGDEVLRERQNAIMLLQSAANTALQLKDTIGAAVLQDSVTKLQEGLELSKAEKKKILLVSKTIFSDCSLSINS